MIRTAKKIQLLEWGAGTNTLNQVWTVVGEGRITRHTMRDGLTTLVISLDAAVKRVGDSPDGKVKLTQLGEGMTGGSNRWGEVALGYISETGDAGRTVTVVIPTATKIDSSPTHTDPLTRPHSA